jgi:hypothetical protein
MIAKLVAHHSVVHPSLPESCLIALPRQELRRFLTGQEMVTSQILPTTDSQSSICRAPKLQLDGLRNNVLAKMAGNSMSSLCCGSMLLVCLLALELK